MGLLPGLPQGQTPAAQDDKSADQSGYVDDEQPNVSPEEQAQYDQFMANALKLIYTPDGVRPEVLEALSAAKGAPSTDTAAPAEQPAGGQAPTEQAEGAMPEGTEAETPAQDAQEAPPTDGAKGGNPAILALAHAAVTIVTQLDDSSKQAGKPISDDVLYHGGFDVLQELAEVADTAKIHDYSPEDITGAWAQAVDMYRPKAISDGRTDEDTLKQQFGEINQADSAGKLGDVLPGLGGEQQATGEPPVQSQQG